MNTAHPLVERYIAGFNETDPHRRRDLIDLLYTDDCAYTDPHVQLQGREQTDQFVAAARQQFPGYVFSLGGPVDAHHEQARFNWHATAPETADPTYIGFDVIIAAGDQIRQVYGFIDQAPA